MGLTSRILNRAFDLFAWVALPLITIPIEYIGRKVAAFDTAIADAINNAEDEN